MPAKSYPCLPRQGCFVGMAACLEPHLRTVPRVCHAMPCMRSSPLEVHRMHGVHADASTLSPCVHMSELECP